MTVKELKEKLDLFDDELEVVFNSSSEMVYFGISSVSFTSKPYDRSNPVVEINE